MPKRTTTTTPLAPITARKAPPPKRRYGRGIAGMTPAKLGALLKAGWVPPEKRAPGRPKKAIDETLVERLAALFHTQREIATLLGCSADTIADRFSDAYWRGRAQVKSKLRKKQLDRAVKDGSDRMLIWLGVQELDQKHRHELSGDPDAPLIFESVVPGSSLPPAAAPEPP